MYSKWSFAVQTEFPPLERILPDCVHDMNSDMKTGRLQHQQGGDALGTLQGLRARLGITQRAFARLTGITQSELSRLETGKVERPQRRTIEAYVQFCGASEEEIQEALLTTIRQFSDPSMRATMEIDSRIRELFVRRTEGQQIDVAGHIIGLGRRLHQATGSEDVRWFGLASTAEACSFALRERSEQVDAAHAEVVEGALLGVMHMCASERGPEAAVDPATFRGILLGTLEPPADVASSLRSVFSYALPVARRYAEGFLRAEDEFDEQWSELQLEAVAKKELPAHYGRLVAASHLLAGVANDVRTEHDLPALQPDGWVSTR
jgi:transcriptional regulator with XRE-family HTH domain